MKNSIEWTSFMKKGASCWTQWFREKIEKPIPNFQQSFNNFLVDSVFIKTIWTLVIQIRTFFFVFVKPYGEQLNYLPQTKPISTSNSHSDSLLRLFFAILFRHFLEKRGTIRLPKPSNSSSFLETRVDVDTSRHDFCVVMEAILRLLWR